MIIKLYKIRKKFILVTMFLMMLIIGTACSSPKIQVSDYVELKFEGVDGEGSAKYHVEENKLVSDVFESDNRGNSEWANDVNYILNSYVIEVTPNEDLENGQEVEITVTVNDDLSKTLSEKSRKVTVEGLEEPIFLTEEELKENVLLYIQGASGRGKVFIDNNFMEDELKRLKFVSKENGNIKNGDEVEVEVENLEVIQSSNYRFKDDAKFKVKVEGLKEVAENINDIENLADVTRLLKEEAAMEFESAFYNKKSHEIVDTYYRKNYSEGNEIFPEKNNYSYDSDQDAFGNGVVAYLMKVTQNIDSSSEKEFYTLYAFPSVILDENNNADISSLGDPRKYPFKEAYSLDTIEIKLKSEGFEKTQAVAKD